MLDALAGSDHIITTSSWAMQIQAHGGGGIGQGAHESMALTTKGWETMYGCMCNFETYTTRNEQLGRGPAGWTPDELIPKDMRVPSA